MTNKKMDNTVSNILFYSSAAFFGAGAGANLPLNFILGAVLLVSHFALERLKRS